MTEPKQTCLVHAERLSVAETRIDQLEDTLKSVSGDVGEMRDSVKDISREISLLRKAMYFIAVALFLHAGVVEDFAKTIPAFVRHLVGM